MAKRRTSDIPSLLEQGIAVISADCVIEYQNQALVEKFGDLTAVKCYEGFFGRKEPCEICALKRAIESSVSEVHEVTSKCGRIYESRFIPFRDTSGVTKVAVVTTDITERKLMEEELRQSEGNLKAYLESAPDGVYINDLKGTFLYGNNKAEELIGYKREELIGKSFLKLGILPAKYLAKAGKLLALNAMGKVTGPDEFELMRKDGTHIWTEITTTPIKEGGGKAVVVGFVRDITERKQAEQRIEHLNAVLRAIRNVNQLIAREKGRDKLLKGVCDNLIETRGCHNAWVAIFGESGELVASAEAGLGKDFLPVVKLLKRGKLTDCAQRALMQPEVVVTEDPFSTCVGCPLAGMYRNRGAMTVRLEYGGKVYGLLAVSIPGALTADKEEQSLFKEVASDVAFALHSIGLEEKRKQAEHNLRERVKELGCLYGIARVAERPVITWDKVYQEITNLLPPSWRYPKITCARITINGKEFKTENCRETEWKQSSDIKVHGEKVGIVEVGYLEERPEIDEGPFLKEERLLIDAVAERLGRMTERKRTEEELIERTRELEAANQAKSEFLASMSHELRTPLNAVIGFSELMLDGIPGNINDEQRQCLSDILSSGQHLLNLINDVLDLSKVEARKMELKLENLNLAGVIDDMMQTVKPMLDDNRHKLRVNIEEGLPQVRADKSRLRQIFLNLLSNAVKFTPAGGELGIEASKKGDWCRVSVIDNGIGIKQEDQERIFEAFTQADTLLVREKEGAGLGLTVTKQLVELGGGRIWVKSEYGKGSKFTFTLPLT